MKKTLVVAFAFAALLGGCAGSADQADRSGEDTSRLIRQAEQVSATCVEETGSESGVCDRLGEVIERDSSAEQIRAMLTEVDEAKARCAKYAIGDMLTPELAFAHASLEGVDGQIEALRAGLADGAQADAVARDAQALAAYVRQVEGEKEPYSCPKVYDTAADMADLREQVIGGLDMLRSAQAVGDVPFQEER